MEVTGLCRFSYVGFGGFQVIHDSLESRRRFLYDPVRMEERFRLFEAIALPSVQGQTDQDFRLLVVIGDCFPELYRERLQALTHTIPQIQIRSLPPMRHKRAMKRTLLANRKHPDQPNLQFRLDDDDAMAIDFVQKLRQTARDAQQLWQNHPAVAVDFNAGYAFQADAPGLMVAPQRAPYLTASLGLIVPPYENQTIMHYGHHKIWSDVPTLTFPDAAMFLRGHNGFNDSRLKGGSKSFDYVPLTPEDEALFKARFNVDNAHVREVFSRPLARSFPQQGEHTRGND